MFEREKGMTLLTRQLAQLNSKMINHNQEHTQLLLYTQNVVEEVVYVTDGDINRIFNCQSSRKNNKETIFII